MIGHQDQINMVRFSSDGTRIVTASNDKTARVWHLPALEQRPVAPSPPVNTRFKDDEDGSVTDTVKGIKAEIQGSRVRLVDTSDGKVLRQLVRHTGAIEKVLFSPDGRQLVTYCEYGVSLGEFDTTVRVWDVASGQQLRQFSQTPGPTMNTVWFSSNGAEIVVNDTVWPATWQEVLRLVNDAHVRSVPRALTPEEKQRYGVE